MLMRTGHGRTVQEPLGRRRRDLERPTLPPLVGTAAPVSISRMPDDRRSAGHLEPQPGHGRRARTGTALR